MRKSWDEFYVKIAKEYASMSTCIRRHVGCVLVDSDNKQLSAGFNGTPPGWPHCDPNSVKINQVALPCPGANEPPGLSDNPTGSLCYSNHAEANAILSCPDKKRIETCYVTTSPCISCVKLLLHTSCKRIVFLEAYPGGDPKRLWLMNTQERSWHHFDLNEA